MCFIKFRRYIHRAYKNRFRLVFMVVIVLLILTFQNMTQDYKNPQSLNYFLDGSNDTFDGGYIVDTPNCKILNISPWDPAVLPFVSTPPKKVECEKLHRQWTYSTDKNLYLNETAIVESGFSLQSLHCCYKRIIRVEQSLVHYDMDADNIVVFSDECTKINALITPIESDFIRVFCTSRSWPLFSDIVYRTFHAFTPQHEVVLNKNRKWHGKPPSGKPPNVVLLGIDSISRLHFHRNLIATREALQSLGAIEILGYTKVGENTFPNNVALLSGYPEDDLKKVCHQTREVEQNSCPYLWKLFSAADYITATVEDAPFLTGFNYQKAGFVLKPTDYYFRPLMLGVQMKVLRKDYYTAECIGGDMTENTMLKYIKNIMKYSENGAPVFIHSWMTHLAHQNLNNARYADDLFAQFLLSTDLNNTILFFISDHGCRYGGLRETLPGWYEDKLPTLWIYIPKSIQKRFPQWKASIQENSIRLTSPFDLYHTMDEILRSFTSVTSFSEGVTPEGITVPRVYGQSLFKPVSISRTCQQAGVSINYCACVPPRKLNVSDVTLQKAGKVATDYLNDLLPVQCAKFKLLNVIRGAIMKDEENFKSTFVVDFRVTPGDFLFEANVEYDQKSHKYSISTDLLRMNKFSTDVSCVHTSLLERYCYCL